MSSSMRLNQSKNIGYKIEIMKWSNRMDLLAISNDKGTVGVHTTRSAHYNMLTIYSALDQVK